MTLHALPGPSLISDAERARDLAAAERRLHQIEQRLQRLQLDHKAAQLEKQKQTWPAVDRRIRDRRGS